MRKNSTTQMAPNYGQPQNFHDGGSVQNGYSMMHAMQMNNCYPPAYQVPVQQFSQAVPYDQMSLAPPVYYPQAPQASYPMPPQAYYPQPYPVQMPQAHMSQAQMLQAPYVAQEQQPMGATFFDVANHPPARPRSSVLFKPSLKQIHIAASQPSESAPREKKVIKILDPKTNENTIKDLEEKHKEQQAAAEKLKKEREKALEESKKIGDEVRKRFQEQICGKRVDKAETPGESTKTVEAEISEEQAKIVEPTEGEKQLEPAVQESQNNNDIDLAASSSEENSAKLLDLERRFNETYELEKDAIANKKYSFDVLELIREIVKCYKKAPTPGDPDLLMKKGLDTRSALPQQHVQARQHKHNFNPNWLKNQQQTIDKQDFFKSKQQRTVGKKNFNDTPLDWKRKSSPKPVLNQAENAWKPKRRGGTAELSEVEKKHEALRKDVRSLLNKITPTSYDDLIKEFKKLDVGQNESTQQIAIELIFDKAVEEPKFCPMYTKLCNDQINGVRSAGSFFGTLIHKVQKTFEGNSAFDADIKKLKSDLESETDTKKKTDLEERLEMLQNKEKRYILGNIKFISHLYTMDLIFDDIIAFCLDKLHQMFEATKDEIFVQYGIELLELVSRIYFSQAKKDARKEKAGGKNSTSDNVTSFINWVSSDECKNNVSTKIKVMIMNFEDFLKQSYTKRNADKVPKKLTELHADIRKEEQKKQKERIAATHETQKRDERSSVQQKPVSLGRSSFVHQTNLQEKKSNAVAASIAVGNTAPAKKIGLNINTGDNKLGKPSYFTKKVKEASSVEQVTQD